MADDRPLRILVVTTEFPPAFGSGVLRLVGIVRGLVKLGHDVTVLTTRARGSNELARYIPPSVKVIRARQWSVDQMGKDLGASVGRTASLGNQQKIGVPGTNATGFRGQAKARARSILKRADYLLFPPMGSTGWVLPAIVQGLSSAKRQDVILSSYGPDAAHVVGYFLSRLGGRPWVADFRDPYLDNPKVLSQCMGDPIRHLVQTLERVFVQRSDHRLTTTIELAKVLARRYGKSLSEDFSVISNGYDKDLFPKPSAIKEELPETFTITFSGSVYDPSSFKPFLQSFERFVREERLGPSDAKLSLIGGSSVALYPLIEELVLREFVKLRGQEDHFYAQEAIRVSPILLIVRDKMFENLCVPAKVFQYILAERPVLCMADDGPLRDLCEEHQLGPVHGLGDVDGAASSLRELYRLHRSGELGKPFKYRNTEVFDRSRLVGRLEGILREVVRRRTA